MKRLDLMPALIAHIGWELPEGGFTSLAAFMPLLERMHSEGANILIKLDGQRTQNHYTCFIAGKILGPDNYSRTDAPTLEDALAHIIVHYARNQWGFTQ